VFVEIALSCPISNETMDSENKRFLHQKWSSRQLHVVETIRCCDKGTAIEMNTGDVDTPVERGLEGALAIAVSANPSPQLQL
jgi:hypothetical protein